MAKNRPALFGFNSQSRILQYGLPLLFGAIIAGGLSVVLTIMKPIWSILILGGLIALIPAIIMKSSQEYWLGLFLITLPMGVQKHFGTEEQNTALLDENGLPWGASAFLLHLYDLPFLALIIIWGVKLVTTDQKLYWPPINYIPLAFVVWVTFGAFFSSQPLLSFFELLRLYKFFFVYLYATNNIDFKKVGKIIITMLLVGLVLQASITLVKYNFQSLGNLFGSSFGKSAYLIENVDENSKSGENLRGMGTFGHPNVTAMYFELVLPFAFALLLIASQAKIRALAIFAFIIGFVGLYITFSRGGMLGFLSGATLVSAIAIKRNWISWKWVAFGLAVTILILPLAVPKLYSYLTTRPKYLQERFAHWQIGAAMTTVSPIIGTGINTSTTIRRGFKYDRNKITDNILPIHNYYLIGIIETGYVGFLLYITFFGKIWLRAYRISESKDFTQSVMALGVLGCYTSLGVHLLVDYFSDDALHCLFWFYAGTIVALLRSGSENGQEEKSGRSFTFSPNQPNKGSSF